MSETAYPETLEDEAPDHPLARIRRIHLKGDMPARIAKIDPVQFAELRDRWGPFHNDPEPGKGDALGASFGCCFFVRAVGIAVWNVINDAQSKFRNAAVLVPVNTASPWIHNFIRRKAGRIVFFQGYFKIGKLPRPAALVLVGAGVEPGIEFADLATGYEVRFMEITKDASGKRVVVGVPHEEKLRRKGGAKTRVTSKGDVSRSNVGSIRTERKP